MTQGLEALRLLVPGPAAVMGHDTRCHPPPGQHCWEPGSETLCPCIGCAVFVGAVSVVRALLLLTSTRKSSRRLNLLRYSCSLLLMSRFLALEYFRKAQNFSSP